MTITPPPSDNFSNYYSQYLSQISPRRGTPASVEFPERTNQSQNLGFLGRTIDILSRPLRIVSNPVMKAVELPEKFDEIKEREAAGEDVSAGEKFAPVGELLAAPFTGFFSDDPSNKPYWADIIEKAEDVENRNDPNYVDVANNVNPTYKGVVGFLGDVVLDPLTWVPGAALAKGWGKAGEVLRGASKSLPGASSKAAKEAAESSAARVIREAPTPPPTLDDATKTPNPAQAAQFIRENIDASKPAKEAAISPLRKLINDNKIFPKGASGGLKRRNQMDSFLKKLQEPMPVPKITVPREILDFDQWSDEVASLAEAGKLDDIAIPFDEIGGVKLESPTLQGLENTINKLPKAEYDRWLDENIDTIDSITEPLYQKYRQAAETNPGVNLFGELSDDAPVVRGAAAAVARLAEMEGVELENARFIFDTGGNRLFDALRQMDEPQFAKFLDDAQYVLSRNGVVEAMGNVVGGSSSAKLLKSFDISVPQFRNAQQDMVQRLAAVVNGAPPAPVDEAAESLANDDGFVEMLRAMLSRDNIRVNRMNFDNTDVLQDIVRAMSQAGAITMRTNFDEAYLKKNYKFILENGVLKVLKTDPVKGGGVARVQDTYGSFTQMTFYQNLGKGMSVLFRGIPERDAAGRVLRDAENKPIYIEPPKFLKGVRKRNAWQGFDLSANLESATLQSMRAWNDWVSARGIPITIDAFYGSERVTEALRFEDIYEVLGRNVDDINRMRLVMFNGDTGMDVTLLGDATIAAMRGASQSEVFEILRRGTNRWNDKPNNNWLAKDTPANPEDVTYYFGHRAGANRPTDGDGFRWVPNKNEKGETIGHYAQWDPVRNAEILADAIVRSRGTLDEVAQIRKQQYLARDITDFQTVSPMVAQNLVDMLKDPTRNAEAMLAIRNVGKMLKDFIAPIDVSEVGAVFSAEALRAAIPQSVRNAVKAAEDIVTARKTGNRNDVFEARQKAVKNDRKAAESIKEDGLRAADEVQANPSGFDDAMRDQAESVKEYQDTILEYNIAKASSGLDPITGIATSRERVLSALNSRWRMGTRDHLSAFLKFLAPNRQAQNWAKQIEKRLRVIKNDKALGGTVAARTPILVQAMRNIQTGNKAADEANDLVRYAQTLLERETAPLFGTANDLIKTIADTGFGRSGATIEEIAKSLESHAVLGKTGTGMARLPENGAWFDIDLAERVAAEEGIDVVSAALRQWSNWGDIEDPVGFIASVNAAVFNVATKAAFIDNFVLDMAPKGLLTRSAAEAKSKGFVQLVADGKTAFGAYLPDNLYVDPEIAYIFGRMDEAFRTSRQLESEFGRWWTDTMDPFMLTWKYTVTVIRTGHHIRNEIGGQSIRWVALGTNGFARGERNAYKIMSFDNNYKDVDILRGLTQLGEQAPAGGETVISGRLGKLTANEALSDYNNSLKAVGRRAEDIYDEGLDGIAKRIADVGGAAVTLGLGTRGGRLEQLALGVSEFVENKARLAHYSQVMDQLSQVTASGKPRQFVRGLGNVVTPKTMAEARQIAIESALKYHPDPALLTAFEAKYMRRIFPFYNWYKQALVALVESAMINPARTLTTIPKATYNAAIAAGIDPYSLYDPFPEDQMFPSFLTEDMTGPQFQFEGQYIAINPGFANIDVFSDTFSDPVAGIVQMTNPIIRTPIELLAGSRLGTQAPIRDVSDFIDSSIPGINYVSNITGRSVTGGFEEQSRIASGDKQAFDQWLSAFNWAFGLGVRNYSRPSYINYAEIEARNEAANQ
jgi:hypothetical protein